MRSSYIPGACADTSCLANGRESKHQFLLQRTLEVRWDVRARCTPPNAVEQQLHALDKLPFASRSSTMLHASQVLSSAFDSFRAVEAV
eukprot:6208927-Pleurochrysis_carterae.AAC.1